jgi:hypothetical protein
MDGVTMEGEPEAYVDDSLRSIGISPRERLARIETLLVAIEQKLDNKASQADMLALEVRVREIETKGTRHTAEAMVESRRLAEERLVDLKELEADFAALRMDHEQLGRRLSWALGAVAAAAVVAEYVMAHAFG